MYACMYCLYCMYELYVCMCLCVRNKLILCYVGMFLLYVCVYGMLCMYVWYVRMRYATYSCVWKYVCISDILGVHFNCLWMRCFCLYVRYVDSVCYVVYGVMYVCELWPSARYVCMYCVYVSMYVVYVMLCMDVCVMYVYVCMLCYICAHL